METLAALKAAIAQRAGAIEDARRLPADLAAAMADAGLFRMLVPRALGGEERPLADVVARIADVAEADASAGWCVMIAATTALVSAWLPPVEAAPVFGNPATITGGVFAPMGKAEDAGEYWRVTGRWSWASGSANCHWLLGGAVLMGDDGPLKDAEGRPVSRMMLMPADAVQLIDSWHVAGLRGTGSGDMAADGVLVPKARSVSFIDDRPQIGGALYAFPAFGLLATGIAAVAYGNARAALAELAAQLVARRPQGSARTAAERAQVQGDFARATAALEAAHALLLHAVADGWRQAERGDGVPLAQRARLRLAATHLARTSADVCRSALDMGGGAALFLANPLQRRFRDAHAITQHVMVQTPTLELAGRVLLGLPVDTRML